MKRLFTLSALGLGLLQACGQSPSDPGDSAGHASSDPTLAALAGVTDRAGRHLGFGRVSPDLRQVGHPGLTLKVRGKFKTAVNTGAGNLPSVNYPLPELYGGRFEGFITLSANAVSEKAGVPAGSAAYACSAVDVSLLSATGVPVHRITSGPSFLRRDDSNTRIALDLNPGAYVPALPGELRLELDGFFKPRDGFAPTADEINQSALRLGFVEIGGPSVGSCWVLDVALLELSATEGGEGR